MRRAGFGRASWRCQMKRQLVGFIMLGIAALRDEDLDGDNLDGHQAEDGSLRAAHIRIIEGARRHLLLSLIYFALDF
ncbi:hypothetical protein RRF57_013171 [Xylaria bambusicola]|uniref:Uncharacterized protein n=1 Tax=Xylaria bambusicola TaxID=326684 RepID=A0AAN7V2I7_9PEZI